MYMKRRYFIGIIAICLFYACQGNSDLKSVKKMIGAQLYFPENLTAILNGKDTMPLNILYHNSKLVVWYDSTECSSCRIRHLFAWNDIISYANSLGNDFDVIFIFSPSYKDAENVNTALHSNQFGHTIYIDSERDFYRQRVKLPKRDYLRCFLLDKNNKVVLVADFGDTRPVISEIPVHYC